MVLKTFSVQEDVYNKFSKFCKENGVNMSKQVEMFMGSMVEEEPEAKRAYLEKLERIRQQKDIHIGSLGDLKKRYKME
ncbi:MAG: hypothetical protein Q8O89_08295 [Nanoarchaeota archaeon]|nr:hypothetical protein [Nanoarchaeota archaeon]